MRDIDFSPQHKKISAKTSSQTRFQTSLKSRKMSKNKEKIRMSFTFQENDFEKIKIEAIPENHKSVEQRIRCGSQKMSIVQIKIAKKAKPKVENAEQTDQNK